MTIPNFPVWATNDNYSVNSDAYDGTPTKVDPSAISEDGFRPGEPVGTQHVNFLFAQFGDSYSAWLIENLFGTFVTFPTPAEETQELGASLFWHIAGFTPRSYMASCRRADYGASGADCREWMVSARPQPEYVSSGMIPGGDTTLRAADVAEFTPSTAVLVQSAASTSGTCLSIFQGGSSPWTHRDDSILDGAGVDRVHADGDGTLYLWRTTDSKFWTNDSSNITSGAFSQDNSNISHILMASRTGVSTLVAADVSSGTVSTQRIDTPTAVVTHGSGMFETHGLVAIGDEYLLITRGSTNDEMIVSVSDDNGATWAERFREQSWPLGDEMDDRQRAFVLEDWLLVYGDSEVFASRDAGRTWSRAPHNLITNSSGKFQVVNGKIYYSDLYTAAYSVGRLSA